MSEQMNFQITAQNNASRAIKDVSRDLGGLKGASQRAGMGIKVAFAAAGIAIVAATKFITDATKAAMEEEKVNKRLIGVLKARKMATEENVTAIMKQVEAGKKLAFGSDEIKSSLATIIPFAKDAGQAIDIQRAAMEVAAAQNISLSKASMLVARAFNGQGKSLQRLGIQTTKTTTVTKRVRVENAKWGASYKTVTKNVKEVVKGQGVLDLIMQKYGGTAAESAKGVEKQFKIFHSTVGDLKQEFGRAFLPIALKIAQTLNKDILPQIKPVITGVAAFITEKIPKFLAEIDPIIKKIAGPGGLVEGFLKMAKAVWGVNGEGPLGKAMSALGELVKEILGMANSVISFITGSPTGSGPTYTGIQYGSTNPEFMPQPGRGPQSPSKNISLSGVPLVGGLLESSGVGINRNGLQTAAITAAVATIVSKVLFKKIPGIGILASAGVGGYMASGAADSGATNMGVLEAFAGGAGALQALSFFGGIMGNRGGGKGMPTMPSAGGGKPGIFGRLGGALLPSFLRPKGGGAGVAAAGAGALGGMGAMSMSANTVYLNAASVVGGGMGMPMGAAGMGMGAMQGPPVPPGLSRKPGIFNRISQGFSNWKGAITGSSQFGRLARVAGAVGSVGSMVAQRTGISTLASGIKGIGGSAIGAVKGAGSAVAGKIAGAGSAIASSGVGRAAMGGARAVGAGAGAVGKGLGVVGKGLGAVGKVASTGLKAVGAGVPLIGGILAGANALAEGNGVGQAIGKGVGNAAGTAIGAGLLSWIPIAGPLLGGLVGGAIGEAIGGAIGEAVDGIPSATTPTGAQTFTYQQYEAGKYKDGKYVGNAIAQYYSASALNGGQAPQVTVVLNDKPLDDMISKVIAKTPGKPGSRILQ
jgi:hypothetical protein